MRNFEAKPAYRQPVSLILGLVSPSSGGKTFTALELATGIQSVVGGDIDLIDTEHGRATFYADKFKFNYVNFEPPFGSLDYLDAIQQSDKRGASVIIVDSMSHEHASEGGMLDAHEQEVTRMAGNDYAKRERVSMLAWQKPKAARRKLLQGITALNAHLIMCFRAKETSKPAKNDQGKNVIIPMGFMPIAGDEFVFESALSVLFHPNAKGVPTWNPEHMGERMAVKIPAQFEWIKDHKGPLNRDIGRKLAEWAKGTPMADLKPNTTQSKPKPQEPATAPAQDLDTPISEDGDLTFADRWDMTISEATDGSTLGADFNAAMKTEDWDLLKADNPKRAMEIKNKVVGKVAELKRVVA